MRCVSSVVAYNYSVAEVTITRPWAILVVVAMVVNCFVHVAMINQYVDSLSKEPVLVTSPFDSNLVSIPLLVYFQLGGCIVCD